MLQKQKAAYRKKYRNAALFLPCVTVKEKFLLRVSIVLVLPDVSLAMVSAFPSAGIPFFLPAAAV